MRGVNKVIIVGHLGNDPESRQFSNGGSVTNISVATSEQWTDKQTGEKREATEWHRVALFNRLGEIAAQYLRKGSQVYIEGSLRTRKWQDQNGQDRYTTEIRAENLQMLGGGGGQGGGYQNNQAPMQDQGGQNQGGYQNQGNDFASNDNNAQVGYQNNQPQNNQNMGMNNQNSFTQGGANSSNNNSQAPDKKAFNNQTSNDTAPMTDTPRDDDIPF